MRSVFTLILVGLTIWSAGFALARRFGRPGGTAAADTTLAFITFWFLAVATYVWIVAAESGRPLRGEAIVFIAGFGIPAAVAAFVRWRFLPPSEE